MRKKDQCKLLLEELEALYGRPDCTLDAKEEPWRLLVAAILAAQCTDARVNLVTPDLFASFPEIKDFAESSPEQIEPYISSCGLYHNKAKSIYKAACTLQEKFHSLVPDTREELLSIPGVGRKIANLLLGECFGQQALVVDTHCGRLARQLGLTQEQEPLKVEKDLMKCVPEERWSDWGHYMVEHGRAVCTARSPKCELCSLKSLCAHGLQIQKKKNG